jgi:integrase
VRLTPDSMTATDVARLMMTLPDSRARAIASLEVYEGLRTGEIARLSIGDYDGTRLVVVSENGNHRDVPLGDPARRCLDAWLRERDDEPGQIFPGTTTGSISDELVAWIGAVSRRRRGHWTHRSDRPPTPGTTGSSAVRPIAAKSDVNSGNESDRHEPH